MVMDTRRALTLLFCGSSIVALLFGLGLWILHSSFRVVALYGLLNIVLFWGTNAPAGTTKSSTRFFAKKVIKGVGACILILLVASVVLTSRSLYTRPLLTAYVIGLSLTLLAVLLLFGTPLGRKGFSGQTFILSLIIAMVLFIDFSIYLVQPNLMAQPAYAAVDAYREYANANRILRMGGVDSARIIGERYYQAYPVVPLEITAISLVAGLPVNISHLTMAMIMECASVVALFLLARLLLTNHETSFSKSVQFLSVTIVAFQPALAEAMFLLQPIRFSIPLVTMAVYLAYGASVGSLKSTRSTAVTIILISLTVVPLHATPSMFLIVFFATMALFFGGKTHSGGSMRRIATMLLIFFLTYVLFSTSFPILSLAGAATQVFLMIREILVHGPFVVGQLAVGTRGAAVSEIDAFLQAAGTGLILSILTVFVVRILVDGRETIRDRGLRSVFFVLGVLLAVAFGIGFVSPLWGIDPRYFNYPMICVALIATTKVLALLLRDMNYARRLMLLALVGLYSLTIANSPSFLHELHPAYARLTPTESEMAAAAFVSARLDIGSTKITQVVADWPFQAPVTALLCSEYLDVEQSVKIPALMYTPIRVNEESIIISRKYFLENTYLRNVSPFVMRLGDIGKYERLNRILDLSSACIYLGTYPSE